MPKTYNLRRFPLERLRSLSFLTLTEAQSLSSNSVRWAKSLVDFPALDSFAELLKHPPGSSVSWHSIYSLYTKLHEAGSPIGLASH